MEVILQGRSWLQEGEPPSAVLQETDEQLKAASDNTSRASWQVVAAEASLAKGDPEAALQAAAEALARFKQLNMVECQTAASSVVIDALAMKQDGPGAVEAAEDALGVCRGAGDLPGQAAMQLKLAKAHLASMQDPYSSAQAAIASCLLFRQVGDSQGDIAALEVAATAHLLYDPEQALKAVKEALAVCQVSGSFKAKASVERVFAAAKSQIATSQHAEQAKAMSCRGDKTPQHKWPKVPQQRGRAALDPFSSQELSDGTFVSAGSQLAVKEMSTSRIAMKMSDGEKKAPVTFMRKPFKWVSASHKTDEAWYRQELTYLPPPVQEKVPAN
eukprot:TRINITY_DN108176_c0_g1_i1.p1 TRINITY_DN108176_c0_g1~~TRINITY_DN108176_c0_g1_i1.p1  ORF type:complete len:330 (-),score=102.74 TRINITY_DN108176_c0_g1_i1:24-1013(-)